MHWNIKRRSRDRMRVPKSNYRVMRNSFCKKMMKMKALSISQTMLNSWILKKRINKISHKALVPEDTASSPLKELLKFRKMSRRSN